MFSSKRIIAFLAFIVMIIAFAADIGFHQATTDYIFNGFLVVVLGSLGITGFEPFAKRARGITQHTTVNSKEADVNVGGVPKSEEE